ncbi:MAG: aminopeptidase [Flavobacteriales bacterium]|jgi:bleomycin hydrolase|nr:aminopeptidase [Flavobacteriales bacterium]MBT3572313.1 aminopeptidase [Flavobacteriales bacterium]MBT4202164.1 aminopeptidase [Flavobacteriales bacterium]MBT4529463.1 aminopeptidase [Flavobacteriales bacterium]MBT5023884.1 aminopeptidase [Flavobacteriales bacterium]
MKNLTIAMLLLPAMAFAQVDLINKVAQNGGDEIPQFEFTTVYDIEATSVKNQARSGTCWSYSSTSFIESEMIRMGKDPIDISEMYTVRKTYQDKADRYVRLHGKLNFSQGGALLDVLYVIKHYGAVPQSVYEGLNYGTVNNDHNEMEAALKGIVDAVVNKNSGTITTAWKRALDGVLDAYLGEEPATFDYQGKSYSPKSFADEVIGIEVDDYIQLTSFTHKPFNAYYAILVPDNWNWDPSFNVPLDDMMGAIDHALSKGFTVDWATDVSEKGFSLKNGVAVMPEADWKDMTSEERSAVYTGPHAELVVTQAMRQDAYNNYQTQDDHGMQIVGKVLDQTGDAYYIVKNSWGDRENDYRTGYIYASEAFVRYKTISVLMHKDALPKAIKKASK